MFNFHYMNRVLDDANVSDKEFRLLYLIVNNMSMNDTHEITIYNGFLMDKLNLSERQVQRLTKSLGDKGYLTKVVTGTSRNKNGNVYRLNLVSESSTTDCDKNVTPYNKDDKNVTPYNKGDNKGDINGDKNVTPYNTGKINKNIKQNINQNINQEMNRQGQEQTTPSVNSRERNEYVDRVFSWMDEKLNYLYSVRDANIFQAVNNEIGDYFNRLEGDRFSSAQWAVIEKKVKRWAGIEAAKFAYFNGGSLNDDKLNDTDNCMTSDVNEQLNTSTGLNDTGAQPCKPFTKEQAIEWVSKDVEKYTNFQAWDTKTIEKFAKRYGKGWDSGRNANACRLYNIAAGWATDYFNRLEDERREALAATAAEKYKLPWEKPLNREIVQQIDPTLDGYLTPSAEDAPKSPQIAPVSDSAVEANNYTTERKQTPTAADTETTDENANPNDEHGGPMERGVG